MNRKIFLLTLVTLFGISAVVVAGPFRSLCDFELADQDLKTHQYLFPKSKITVISVADARGSDQLAPWIQRIYEKYENRIDIDGVADLVAVPKPFRAILRQTLSKQLTRPVMLDWHGTVVKRFASEKHVANIYVVDRHGYIVKHPSGPVSDVALLELYGEINRAIADISRTIEPERKPRMD